MSDLKQQILEAALGHVVFDGWTDTILTAAAEECGVPTDDARMLFPRGGVDLALAFHAWGDAEMVKRLEAADLNAMRVREKITFAVRTRLEVIEDHKEAVRRGTTLFALPIYATDGARAIWQTCDAIWEGLHDPSEDLNWYTKRATLAGVHSSTVLFWLGDTTEDNAATWDFLDRRIENVMQIEKLKARVNDNPMLKPFMAGPNWLASMVRAPSKTPPEDMPGYWDNSMDRPEA